jgi:cytochrome c oxidase subunit 2
MLFNFLINEDSLLAFDSIMVDLEPRLLCVDNPLNIPTHTNILLAITSADVIHSFALPAAGIKVDAIPGRVATVGLFVLGEHTFYGQCSELCGANHGFMPIMVRSLSRNI